MTPERIAAAALTSARLNGCTCAPDIEVRERGSFPGVMVKHDAWCPLLIAIQKRDSVNH